MARKRDRAAFMISVVSEQYEIHPQTLRLYEREGLLQPSRTEGNTRLYTEKDLERLEVILSLTRDLGVNLAGVEIILNMREKMDAMQRQMQEFIACLSQQMTQAQTPPPAPDASGRALVPLTRRAAPAPSRDRKGASRSGVPPQKGGTPTRFSNASTRANSDGITSPQFARGPGATITSSCLARSRFPRHWCVCIASPNSVC